MRLFVSQKLHFSSVFHGTRITQTMEVKTKIIINGEEKKSYGYYEKH